MLSKIVPEKEVETEVFEKYVFPSADEVGLIIAERKRELQRERIVEENPDDPVKAARNEANKILVEAQEKLKAAEVEANVLKNKKEKELRMVLEKEFQAKLEQQLNQLKQSYTTSLEELALLKQALYKNSETQMMDLVFAVARKVIDDEIKTSPELVVKMMRKGFDKVSEAKECEVRINPQDYDLALQLKDEIKESLKTAGAVKFTKDDAVDRGGCKIITEHGEISSEPGQQLDIIMRELTNEA